jgi:hypothetical protein
LPGGKQMIRTGRKLRFKSFEAMNINLKSMAKEPKRSSK